MDNATLDLVPSSDPRAIGKKVKVLLNVDDHSEWYEGVVVTYNIINGNYGTYFPCDNKIVETTLILLC